MKFKETIIFIFIILTGCKSNKEFISLENENLYPIGKNGKWGFTNENGEIEIPYQFDKVTFFIGQRASVKQNGKFGFIDTNGKYLLKPYLDSIGYFNRDEADVFKNGKRLTINRKGKEIGKGITIIGCGTGIEYATDPSLLFKFKDNKYILNKEEFENQKRFDPSANFKLEDFTFDEVIPFSSKSVIVRKNNKYDIYVHYNSIGLKGIWADEITPNFQSDNELLIPIQANNAKYKINKKWGLISNIGHIELEPEFYSIEFTQGIYYIVEYQPQHWGTMTLKNRYYKSM